MAIPGKNNRTTEEEYLKAKLIVEKYLYELRNPDDCVVCGMPTGYYTNCYAGDKPICTDACLEEWDHDNPNPFSESENE